MEVGLVLSGGGARGISHLGVIKSIIEHDITIKEISGTSSGSILGALYGSGYSPEDILEVIIKTNFFRLLRPAFSLNGLLSMAKIGVLLENYIEKDNFQQLTVPLTIAATNIEKGNIEYFSTGELIQPVLCSCSIPVIFQPVKFKGSYYIDGGILNNLPVEPIRERNDFVIGSHCNPISDTYNASNMKNLLERSMLLAINGNSKKSKQLCDLLIEPLELENVGGFEIKKAKKMYLNGYNAANKALDQFLSVKKLA